MIHTLKQLMFGKNRKGAPDSSYWELDTDCHLTERR